MRPAQAHPDELSIKNMEEKGQKTMSRRTAPSEFTATKQSEDRSDSNQILLGRSSTKTLAASQGTILFRG